MLDSWPADARAASAGAPAARPAPVVTHTHTQRERERERERERDAVSSGKHMFMLRGPVPAMTHRVKHGRLSVVNLPVLLAQASLASRPNPNPYHTLKPDA